MQNWTVTKINISTLTLNFTQIKLSWLITFNCHECVKWVIWMNCTTNIHVLSGKSFEINLICLTSICNEYIKNFHTADRMAITKEKNREWKYSLLFYLLCETFAISILNLAYFPNRNRVAWFQIPKKNEIKTISFKSHWLLLINKNIYGKSKTNDKKQR